MKRKLIMFPLIATLLCIIGLGAVACTVGDDSSQSPQSPISSEEKWQDSNVDGDGWT